MSNIKKIRVDNARYDIGVSDSNIEFTETRGANTVLAAPSDSIGVASFRTLTKDDIPSLTVDKISDFPQIDTAPTQNSNNLVTSGGVYNALPIAATDTELGTVKTNYSTGISLDNDGKLIIDGRIGHIRGGTGLYAPNTISPASVGDGSLLVTEANNITLGRKSLSVTTGMNVTLASSAAAGSTSYQVTNNYVNRILCTIALNGMACLNEDNAANTVKITSITLDGTTIAPSSTNSSTSKIIITTEASANPNSSTTKIRIYPEQKGFSNLLFGVAGTESDSNGYSVIGGQQIKNASNASAVFGNTQYNSGNSSLIAGRQHINTKQNAFLAGVGHDTTNGSTEVSAVGKWSNITSTTLFAVGNGSSEKNRSNAFTINNDGTATVSANPVNNMDVATKQYVDTIKAQLEAAIALKADK